MFPKILNDIRNLLLPEVCFGCNAHLSGGEQTLCTVCRYELPLTDYNFAENNPVDHLFYGKVAIKKASAFLFFSQNGIVKHLLHYLKYQNQEDIGRFIGEWYGSLLKTDSGLDPIDAVIPVPLHAKKMKKRGYNQVDRFGAILAKKLDADFLPNAIRKTRNTRTQTKKTRGLRRQNTLDLYELNPTTNLKGKTLLLVDDVITTGATMEACASVLLQIPNSTVYCTAMAVVPPKG